MGKTYRKDDDYNGYRKEQSKKNSKNFRKERKNSKEYYLSSDEEGFTVIELIFAITVILGLVGYVANIVKLISFATSDKIGRASCRERV